MFIFEFKTKKNEKQKINFHIGVLIAKTNFYQAIFRYRYNDQLKQIQMAVYIKLIKNGIREEYIAPIIPAYVFYQLCSNFAKHYSN